MAAERHSVFDILSASSHTRNNGRIGLGDGCAATLWSNSDDRIRYEAPGGHTFSLYYRDGTGTRRIDGAPRRGWPGAITIMPQGQTSEWEITQPFDFVHLYVPDEVLRRSYAEIFDRDARLMSLPEITLGEGHDLTAGMMRLAGAVQAGEPVLAEQAMAEVIGSAFSPQTGGGLLRPDLKGGLAPHMRRRLRDHIEAHLAETLSLADLAVLAGLSAFHFQRSFTASFGVSPHAWITRRRVIRAMERMRAGEPLASLAVTCGFSSQSHLTRVFRSATGRTPAAWRAGVGSDIRTPQNHV